MPQLGLKQFRVTSDTSADAFLSYCVWDLKSRRALLIDPHSDALDEYASFLLDNGLELALTLDTALHWSHLSAAPLLRDRYGCGIAMSEKTSSLKVDRKLKDHERLDLGQLSLEVILTPGVTEDSLALFTEGALLSGNTLWISSCAPGGSSGSNASSHWESLQKIRALSQDRGTLVLPAFDSNCLIFSTLEIEKVKNPALTLSKDEFVKWSADRAIVPDSSFKEIAQINAQSASSEKKFSRLESVFKNAGKIPDGELLGSGVAAITVEKYAHKLEQHSSKYAFIDVREPSEFLPEHIAGTQNFPLFEVGFHLKELSAKERVYVSCLSGRRSSWVARTLAYLNFPDVVNVTGGFKAWKSADLPIESSQ